MFRSPSFILVDRGLKIKGHLKFDEGVFLRYSTNTRAYRLHNNRTTEVMESQNIVEMIIPKLVR